jgi:hypothetical protein
VKRADLIALILAQQVQIEAQAQQISGLTGRIAELEAGRRRTFGRGANQGNT